MQLRSSCTQDSSLFVDPQSDSHESALARGRGAIAGLVEQLHITPNQEVTESAHRLYRLAMQRGFTRGRRVDQVRARVCVCVCVCVTVRAEVTHSRASCERRASCA